MGPRQHSHSLEMAAALVLAAFVAGCEPSPAPRAQLSEEARLVDPQTGDFLVPPASQANLAGALEMLFGTTSQPHYLLLGGWIEEGFDPNHPERAAGDLGSGEFNEDMRAALRKDNQRRFERELALIDAGRAGDVRLKSKSRELYERWIELQAGKSAAELGAPSFKEAARALLSNFYPSLRESAELYQSQCQQCHGTEGGGDGPSGAYLDPIPRDFRHGVFKFTAVRDRSVPRRADIVRVLEEGIVGTPMLSFRRFSDAELAGLADYVRLLSIRGMVERDMVAGYRNDEPMTPDSLVSSYSRVWAKWHKADTKFIDFDGLVPSASPASIERGRKLYLDDARGGCAKCHGVDGRGDGIAVYKQVAVLDSKGNPIVGRDGKQRTERVSAHMDDWGRPSLPRDLTEGLFRGGKQPIDVYRRIYAGINGTAMPAVGDAKTADGQPLLDDGEMWDIVHYVLSLSGDPAAER